MAHRRTALVGFRIPFQRHASCYPSVLIGRFPGLGVVPVKRASLQLDAASLSHSSDVVIPVEALVASW